MPDALLLVDVLKDFRHEDGDALLASYRRRHPQLLGLLEAAREAGRPVVYANDGAGRWGSDPDGLVREAVARGKAGELVAAVAPRQGEPLVLKNAYSAFDGTSLADLLGRLGSERILLAGTATEMCVFQTALDGRRAGFEVVVRGDASASVDGGNARLALDYLERVLELEVVRPLE
jgi:nicotinamidase-related amidase